MLHRKGRTNPGAAPQLSGWGETRLPYSKKCWRKLGIPALAQGKNLCRLLGLLVRDHQGRSTGGSEEVRTEPGGPADGKKGISVPIFGKVNEKTWVITSLSVGQGIAGRSIGVPRKQTSSA